MISHRGISVITPLPFGGGASWGRGRGQLGKGEGPAGDREGAAPINQKSCHPKG